MIVKNEDICQVIREERGVCKDWSGICKWENCRWRVWRSEGDTEGLLVLGLNCVPLKKRY